MTTAITIDNLPSVLAYITDAVLRKETIFVESGMEEGQYFINDSEYLSGVTGDRVDVLDFISELKQRYDYPKA